MPCRFVNGRIEIYGPTLRPQTCSSCSRLCDDLCDGCDRAVCSRCSTSPGPRLAFCPGCSRPQLLVWAASAEGKRWKSGAAALKLPELEHRELRRTAFRKWARDNLAGFEALRSEQSLRVAEERRRQTFAENAATRKRPTFTKRGL